MQKEETVRRTYQLFKVRENIYDCFNKKIFPLARIEGTERLDKIAHVAKVPDRSHIKILSPKKMLQRLPKALVHLKANNTCEKLAK